MADDYEYTSSHSDDRLIVNIVNSLLKMGQKLDLGVYKFDRNVILEDAIKKTGYKNFGNEKYIEVLDRLIDNIDKVDMTPLGKYFLNFIARRKLHRKTPRNRRHTN